GAFGPGFPAKGRTASANIAYVQMKAILIVKAERAGALRALVRSLSGPLMHALTVAHVSLWGAEFSTYSFEIARCTSDLRCDAQQRRLVFMRQRVGFAVLGPQMALLRHHEASPACPVSGVKRSYQKHWLRSEFDPEPTSS